MYHRLRTNERVHVTNFCPLAITQFHTSSSKLSSPPLSSHDGPWCGFFVAINRSTSFTVTSPTSFPWSSTRITRGLQNYVILNCRQKLVTYPIRLNSCMTISNGNFGATVNGVCLNLNQVYSGVCITQTNQVHPWPYSQAAVGVHPWNKTSQGLFPKRSRRDWLRRIRLFCKVT